jgi:RNA polymerase sigma-70 factor (ECF subfamily)
MKGSSGENITQTDFLRNVIGDGMNQEVDDNTPDEKLIELFLNENDQNAFEEIFNRYVDKIYGIALGISRDPNSTEDIIQDVFLTLMKKIDTFEGRAKFSTWLYRVTVNASYMHLRAEKKYESDYSLENYVPYDENGTLTSRIKDKDWSSRPDILNYSKEAMEILVTAINELPETYRIVCQLRDVNELSNEEISEILGISSGAVKSRLHRARLYLRDKISDYFYEWRQDK